MTWSREDAMRKRDDAVRGDGAELRAAADAKEFAAERRTALETELCWCLHTKADHDGMGGHGACAVVVLQSNTFVGACRCEKFTWKCWIGEPPAKLVEPPATAAQASRETT